MVLWAIERQNQNQAVWLEVSCARIDATGRNTGQHGAKAELLPLLKLRGIGRVRARKLFRARIKTLEDVKQKDYADLAQLLGKKTALSIKKQVGQDMGKVKVKTGKRKGQKSVKDF